MLAPPATPGARSAAGVRLRLLTLRVRVRVKLRVRVKVRVRVRVGLREPRQDSTKLLKTHLNGASLSKVTKLITG